MRRPGFVALLLLAGCATAPPPRDFRLTVDAIYSGPRWTARMAADPQWRADGALSYIEDGKLLLCDPATGTRTTLLDFDAIRDAAPDGAEPRPIGRATPGRYWWSRDGGSLLIHIRGDLWSWRDGRATRLTRSPAALLDPKWSPDAKRVAFVRDHDLWTVDLDGVERRLTTNGSATLLNGELDWVYPEELGLGTAYWWSPDSSRILYLQLDQAKVSEFPLTDYRPRLGQVNPLRYPKAGDTNPTARLFIVDLDGNSVAAADAPDAYIARADWTPDGKPWFQRLNRDQTRLELVLLDPATLAPLRSIEETDAAWVSVTNDLVWIDGGFLWTSERDGWRHIYRYGDGPTPLQLTSGPWEVSRICSAAGGRVYFESNEGDLLGRNLWSVAVDGGTRRRHTLGGGCHATTPSPAGDRFIDVHSSAGQPPRMSIQSLAKGPVVDLGGGATPALDALALPLPEFLTLKADGVELPAMLIRPRDFDPSRRYPVLIHTYGGPGAQLVVDRWQGNTFLWHSLLAERGIIVFTLDNRGSGGKGRDWERLLHGRLGDYEVRDQLNGVAWLKTQSWVDPSRIALWGWSYGGYLTCQAMTASDAFRAGIAVAPVTDWRLYDTIYTERYLDLPAGNAAGYEASSPVHRAAQLQGRLLLVHGMDDDNVHFQNAVVFADRLIEAKKPFDLMMYPGKAHGINGDPARIHLFEMMTAFLLRELKP